MTDRFTEALGRGPLVLDAGLGTRLIALGLDLAHDDPSFWNLTRPDAVRELHARDVAAGAQAIVTNTFGANRAWLARWDRAADVERLNRGAVSLAREAAGGQTLLFGSIGPTASSLPGAVVEQAEILTDAGADALLLETHRFEQAEAALRALSGRALRPVLVSLFAWPESVAESAGRLADLEAAVLGVNCQLGMAQALALIEKLRPATPLPLLAKPGAGKPGDDPESPESFARAVPRLLDCGVRLLGGCCGTTDAHVAALRAACYDRASPATR